MSGFFDFQESLRPPRRAVPAPSVAAAEPPKAKAEEVTSKGRAPADAIVSAALVSAPAAPAGANVPTAPLSITEFTRQVKLSLKTAFPATVTLQGELSNYRGPHASGHHYFCLKDSGALLNAVMFATSARSLKFKLGEGMEVIASGRLDLYEQGGKYNFIVTSISPVGTGALELAYRQLYAKLAAEGLFAPERKKALPRYPRTIALVTSKAAAGLQDQLKILTRYPFLRLIVVHVPVQGEGASARIASALDGLSREHHHVVAGGIDLILLGRGGGSYEDLFEFSREDLARAVARCTIPIITGIGHEVDTAIADLVADYHAHTPTEAATHAVRLWTVARARIDAEGLKLHREMRAILDDAKQQLNLCRRHPFLCRAGELTHPLHQRVDDREQKLALALRARLTLTRRNVDAIEARLRQHDPRRVLLARRDGLFKLEQRLASVTTARFRAAEVRLTQQAARLAKRNPAGRLPLLSERVSAAARRLSQLVIHSFQFRTGQLAAAESQLRILGPDSVLARGYTLTTLEDGSLLRTPAGVPRGALLNTRTAAGMIRSRVE